MKGQDQVRQLRYKGLHARRMKEGELSGRRTIFASLAILTALFFLLGVSPACKKAMTAADWIDLGDKYLLEQDHEEAWIAFNKALELDPGNITIQLKLSETHILRGQIDEARAILLKILEADKDHIEALAMLQELERGLQAEDSKGDSLSTWEDYYESGEDYKRRGDFVSATRDYYAAIDLDSSQASPYLRIAEIEADQDDIDSAKEILAEGIKASSDPGILLDYLDILNRLPSIDPDQEYDGFFSNKMMQVHEIQIDGTPFWELSLETIMQLYPSQPHDDFDPLLISEYSNDWQYEPWGGLIDSDAPEEANLILPHIFYGSLNGNLYRFASRGFLMPDDNSDENWIWLDNDLSIRNMYFGMSTAEFLREFGFSPEGVDQILLLLDGDYYVSYHEQNSSGHKLEGYFGPVDVVAEVTLGDKLQTIAKETIPSDFRYDDTDSKSITIRYAFSLDGKPVTVEMIFYFDFDQLGYVWVSLADR